MRCFVRGFICSVILSVATISAADELTQMIQKDLVTLGYEPGNTDGEATTGTAIAISKFQAQHDLLVTGEASPQLAGITSSQVDKQAHSPVDASDAGLGMQADPEVLKAAQQACLQDKVAAAENARKKKQGFSRILSAVSRTASSTGNYDLSRTVGDVYQANATAGDLSAAAKDLGLTTDDVTACQNP